MAARLRWLAPVLLVLAAGCVMVPRTVARYDPECRIVRRQMTLQPVQIASIGGCSNEGCATLVAVAAVTGAASMVVSGSIALVGNVVYWAEWQGRCQRGAEPAVPPGLLPPPPSPAPAG